MQRAACMLRRHPVASYFVLAFAISWGGIAAVVGPTHLLASKDVFDSLVWVPALLLGPSAAGIVVTAAVRGWRDLGSHLARLRVGPRWYLVALLTAPVYYVAVSLVLSGFSRAYLPAIVTTDDPAGALARGFVVGLSAGVFEELGWTGLAVPALLRRRGALGTGLIVGSLWGLWHVVPKLLGERAFDTVGYLPIDLGCAIVSLTGFRILMVWVYERTQSLPLAMLMHASLTAGLFVAQPAVTGRALMVVAVAQAIAIWLLVAAVIAVQRVRLRGWTRRTSSTPSAGSATSGSTPSIGSAPASARAS
ncbi:MAG: CPBP family intramembrane glutamic endopeptidase [Acidobacteriota bacterium]